MECSPCGSQRRDSPIKGSRAAWGASCSPPTLPKLLVAASLLLLMCVPIAIVMTSLQIQNTTAVRVANAIATLQSTPVDQLDVLRSAAQGLSTAVLSLGHVPDSTRAPLFLALMIDVMRRFNASITYAAWCPRVLAADRAAFEARLATSTGVTRGIIEPAGSLTAATLPAGNRSEYLPLLTSVAGDRTFVSDMQLLLPTVGLDMSMSRIPQVRRVLAGAKATQSLTIAMGTILNPLNPSSSAPVPVVYAAMPVYDRPLNCSAQYLVYPWLARAPPSFSAAPEHSNDSFAGVVLVTWPASLFIPAFLPSASFAQLLPGAVVAIADVTSSPQAQACAAAFSLPDSIIFFDADPVDCSSYGVSVFSPNAAFLYAHKVGDTSCTDEAGLACTLEASTVQAVAAASERRLQIHWMVLAAGRLMVASVYLDPSVTRVAFADQVPLIVATSLSACAAIGFICASLFARNRMARAAAQDARAKRRELAAARAGHERTVEYCTHHMRNPVHVMRATAELLLHNSRDTQQRRDARMLVDKANDLTRLLEDLNDLSALAQGHLSLRYELIDLRTMIASVVAMFANRRHDRRPGISVEVDAAAPLSIVTDPLRLQQILNNGLHNACEHSRGDTVFVSVDLDATRALVIRIVNDGKGLGPRPQSTLVQPFYTDIIARPPEEDDHLTSATAKTEESGQLVPTWFSSMMAHSPKNKPHAANPVGGSLPAPGSEQVAVQSSGPCTARHASSSVGGRERYSPPTGAAPPTESSVRGVTVHRSGSSSDTARWTKAADAAPAAPQLLAASVRADASARSKQLQFALTSNEIGSARVVQPTPRTEAAVPSASPAERWAEETAQSRTATAEMAAMYGRQRTSVTSVTSDYSSVRPRHSLRHISSVARAGGLGLPLASQLSALLHAELTLSDAPAPFSLASIEDAPAHEPLVRTTFQLRIPFTAYAESELTDILRMEAVVSEQQSSRTPRGLQGSMLGAVIHPSASPSTHTSSSPHIVSPHVGVHVNATDSVANYASASARTGTQPLHLPLTSAGTFPSCDDLTQLAAQPPCGVGSDEELGTSLPGAAMIVGQSASQHVPCHPADLGQYGTMVQSATGVQCAVQSSRSGAILAAGDSPVTSRDVTPVAAMLTATSTVRSTSRVHGTFSARSMPLSSFTHSLTVGGVTRDTTGSSVGIGVLSHMQSPLDGHEDGDGRDDASEASLGVQDSAGMRTDTPSLPPLDALQGGLPQLRLHVLYVDDDVINLRLMARLLNMLGCTFNMFEDGVFTANALIMSGQLPPEQPCSSSQLHAVAPPTRNTHLHTAPLTQTYDLILLDIIMPRSDGAEVCAHLRSHGVSVPIVAVTANGRNRQHLFACGFDDIADKPCGITDIVRCVRSLQEAGRLRDVDGRITSMSSTRTGGVISPWGQQERTGGASDGV